MQTHANTCKPKQILTRQADLGTVFGLTFFVVFPVLALWPLPWQDLIRPIALGIALIFLGTSLIAPALLATLNRL